MNMNPEKGIPIPPPGPGGSKCKYAWPKMGIGDSVWYPVKSKNHRASIKISAHQWFGRNKPHLRVIARTELEEVRKGSRILMVKGIRIWVIEGVTICHHSEDAS